VNEAAKALKDIVVEALRAALQEYGPGTVLLLLFTAFLLWLLNRSWEKRIKDKDEEIKRLVTERGYLQDIILKKRLSTDNQSAPGKKRLPK